MADARLPSITVKPIEDPFWLEERWRGLEARADGSFFQSWTWVGCLAAERFDNALVMQALHDGEVVGLALGNRRRWPAPALFLGESGRHPIDNIFVEHNGPLLAANHADLLAPCLAALGRRRRLILSGVDDDVLAAARSLGGCRTLQSRPAAFVDLAALGDGDSYLASLGASTRYALRRSERRYAEDGQIVLSRASTVAVGLSFLDRLVALHQASWTRKGQPGAFAEPDILRFHRALIAAGLPRGEIDLLRIAAGRRDIGYLYNFRWRGRVYAYQSGFDYAVSPHHKPGLTCHHRAIEMYRAEHCAIYDFLAGDSRYKTNLGSQVEHQHWLELMHPWSPRFLLLELRGRLKRGARTRMDQDQPAPSHRLA